MKKVEAARHPRTHGHNEQPKKVRIQFELLPERNEDLDRIMAETGIATKKDLLEQALTFFEWAIEQTKIGCEVGLRMAGNEFHPLLFPTFWTLGKKYERDRKKNNPTGESGG